MKAQPERKWSYVKAGILAAFALALAGLATALPNPAPSPTLAEPEPGNVGDPHGLMAAARAEIAAPIGSDVQDDDAGTPVASRDPSLAGLRVSPDAPASAPIDTF